MTEADLTFYPVRLSVTVGFGRPNGSLAASVCGECGALLIKDERYQQQHQQWHARLAQASGQLTQELAGT